MGVFEAKTRLSELLEHVRLGRVYRITIAADFDAPVPGFEPYAQ